MRTRKTGWLVAIFAACIIMGTITRSRAETVTWTGTVNNQWTADDAGNWDGEYNDGDDAVFDDTGSNTNPIHIDGTVAPGSLLFSNSTAKAYTIRDGILSGSGTLTKTDNGITTVVTAGTTPINASGYSGAIAVNQGTLRLYIDSGLDTVHNLSLGSGIITVNNAAALQVRAGSSSGASNGLILDNPIAVGAAGGNIVLERPANIRGTFRFAGPITLGGNVAFSGTAGAYGTTWTLAELSLSADATMTNNQSDSKALALSKLSASTTRTLTLAGPSPINLPVEAAADLALKNLVVATGAGMPWLGTLTSAGGATSGATTSVDLLSGIRANGGTVTLESDANVQFGRGNWRMTDFVFDGNNSIYLNLGGQNSTAFFDGGITLGGVGNPVALIWSTGQNNYIGIENGYELNLSSGGQLRVDSVSNVARIRGDVRMTNGSLLNMIFRDSRRLERSNSGTLYLGDGNAATAETMTITGQITLDNSANTVELRYTTAQVSDDGNTILRYANTGSADRGFNLSWKFETFREGSAGTEFAPLAGSLGVSAVGGPTGPVASFTKPAVLTTGGRVAFHNSTGTVDGSSRAALGELVIAATGRFEITNSAGTVQAALLTVDGGTLGGIGTFQAADLVFTNSAVYEVQPTGPGTGDCGLLDIAGTLTFESGSVLTVNTNLYEPQTDDVWHIAVAGTIDGVPSIPTGYGLENDGGTLKLTKLASGDAPVIRNDPVADVTTTAATAHGFLLSTGSTATAVHLLWGASDGEVGTWDNTVLIGNDLAPGAVSAPLSLVADNLYYYRFRATNVDDIGWGSPSVPFMTAAVWVDEVSDAYEDGLVTGWVRVARPAQLTNAVIALNYVVSGDATPDADYVAITGTVAFALGETNAWFNVEPLADTIVEGDETVTITLLPGPYVLGAPSEGTVTIFDRTARELVWTDGDGTQAWNLTDENWQEGAVPAVYGDGENVTFDGGADANPITIRSAGVEPGTVTITGGSHTFHGGSIVGATPLWLTGAGTTRFDQYGANETLLDYTGGSVVSNDAVFYHHVNSTANQMHTVRPGSGPVTLDNGTYRVRAGSSGDTINGLTVSADIITASTGGLLDIVIPNNLRGGFVHTNTVTLGGNLEVAGNHVTELELGALRVTESGSKLSVTGLTSLNVNAVTNSLGMALAVGGTQPIAFRTPMASSLQLGDLDVVDATVPRLTIGVVNGADSYGASTGRDALANIRANSQTVGLYDGTVLQLGAGDWRLSDFVFPGNNTVELHLGGQGNTAYFPETGVLGSAAGLARTLRWVMGQNNALGVAGGAELQVENGGQFWVDLNNNGGQIRGDVRLLQGGRLNLTVVGTQTRTLVRGSGMLYLGDGNPATPETIEIGGLIESDNPPHLFDLAYGSSVVSDDGNVVLHYAGNSGTALRRFNLTWNYDAFRGGSAGTVFAPHPDNLGIAAVGPASGTVFAITNVMTHASAGTVGFYHAAGTEVGLPGGLGIDAGAELRFDTNGTVVAGDVSFGNDSHLQVAITGANANDASLIESAGTLTFGPGTTIGVTLADSVQPEAFQTWIIATAETAVSGVPAGSGRFDVQVEAGTPHLVKLVTRPAGSLFLLR